MSDSTPNYSLHVPPEQVDELLEVTERMEQLESEIAAETNPQRRDTLQRAYDARDERLRELEEAAKARKGF